MSFESSSRSGYFWCNGCGMHVRIAQIRNNNWECPYCEAYFGETDARKDLIYLFISACIVLAIFAIVFFGAQYSTIKSLH